jgi:hypothetical protein
VVVTWRARGAVGAEAAVAASSRHDSRLCAGFAPVIQVEYTNARTEHRRPSLTQRATKDFTSVRAREEKTGLMPSEAAPDLSSPRVNFARSHRHFECALFAKIRPRRRRQKVNLRPTDSLPETQTQKGSFAALCVAEGTRPSRPLRT